MQRHDPNHEYSDDCPGCRPVIQDAKTGDLLPDDDPVMVKVRDAFYNKCTLAERRAWHRALFQSSRNSMDHFLARKVANAMAEAMGAEVTRWAKPGEIEAMQDEFERRRNQQHDEST